MRVVVGRLGRPHGIRGEVTVEVRTDEPDMRFALGTVLFVNGSDRRLTVERIHWHSGRLLVTFDGIADRTAAESLRGLVVEVERAVDETPEDPEEFYDSALTGCMVEGLDGMVIGVVAEVILATNFTAEGEATAHIISEVLRARGLQITRLARGVPVGSELEYVDLGTIAHALADRR